jgi:hypothetical protein
VARAGALELLRAAARRALDGALDAHDLLARALHSLQKSNKQNKKRKVCFVFV